MSLPSGSKLASELAQIVKCEVFSAADPDYEREVKRVWNARLYSKKPLMFVKAESQNDILETLMFCKKNKLPLCMSNGGTSMFALEDGAVVLILVKMNSVTVDQKSKIAEVECGALQGDVDKATAKYHLATTLGQVTYVGATGSGLLLGMGLLGRSYGYTIDNIHAIEMITASGEMIKISAVLNRELFWAMKGFGFNFGIVTKISLNLHPMPSQVVAGHLFFPWKKAADTLKNMRDFLEEKQDGRLVLYGLISTEKERGKIVIFLRFIFNGEVGQGLVLLDEFRKRSSPTSCDVKPTSYDLFQSSVDDLHPFGNYYFDDKGGFLFKELSDDVIDTLIALYNQLPSVSEMSGSACYVIPVGCAYSKVPEDSSPFLFRDARYRITNVCSTPNPDFEPKLSTWLDGTCKALCAVSMKTDQSKSDEAWERLCQVKRQYDPENIFKYNINIRPD